MQYVREAWKEEARKKCQEVSYFVLLASPLYL